MLPCSQKTSTLPEDESCGHVSAVRSRLPTTRSTRSLKELSAGGVSSRSSRSLSPQKQLPAVVEPARLICQVLRARSSPVSALSRWTIGESDAGANGDDPHPHGAAEAEAHSGGGVGLSWRAPASRLVEEGCHSSATERSPSSSKQARRQRRGRIALAQAKRSRRAHGET